MTYNFLSISQRQWADIGPPPPEITPTVKIEKMKLIHFLFPQLDFF